METFRIAQNEKDAVSASRIYALSWKAGYRGILSERLLAGLPLDFWVSDIGDYSSPRRFEVHRRTVSRSRSTSSHANSRSSEIRRTLGLAERE